MVQVIPGIGAQGGLFARREKVYPAIQGGATGQHDASSTFTCPLPADIQAGELLLLFVYSLENGPSGAPSGWSVLFNLSSANVVTASCFYKTATGAEGSTVNVAMSTSWRGGVSLCVRIKDWSGTPEAATAGPTYNNAPNAPNCSPSWGSDLNLWLTGMGSAITATSITGTPAGMTSYSSVTHTAGYPFIGALAYLNYTGASYDAGNWTLNASTYWRAMTVVVKPAPV
ncbi:MAG: hypothetical protein E6R03_16645 [Hyphomicrobiaceae bacterium]|nr:MAG: hypothetical protein E6R03_16645 [Hyphomicrobiaceae bacterium]